MNQLQLFNGNNLRILNKEMWDYIFLLNYWK